MRSKMNWIWFAAMALVSLVGIQPFLAQAKPGEAKPPEFKHKFVGVANCKLCHSDEATGDQFGQWKKTKHSEALKTLSSPKAKEIAKEKGIADPAKEPKCLKCHITGYEAPKDMKARTYKETDSVGCESCHGAGGDYAKEDVFKKGKEAAVALGLVEPDEKVCLKCHNKESPSYKEFDFKERSQKIAHPNPKKKK